MKEADLITNPDGSIYHLKLRQEEIPDLILLSGDPARISLISEHFDDVEFRRENREFVSHAGTLKGKRLLALSTGIGPDNMDIVMNELDALANINLITKENNPQRRVLTIVRIGTSGAMQEDIPVGTLAVASHGMGMDGSLHYYRRLAEVVDHDLTREFIRQTNWPAFLPTPYIIPGTPDLIKKLSSKGIIGITATAGGFYGPQGRELRLRTSFPGMIDAMARFSYMNHRIINFEMETSSLYGLGAMLGHQVASICVLIANRVTGEFTRTIRDDEEKLISYVLEKMTS